MMERIDASKRRQKPALDDTIRSAKRRRTEGLRGVNNLEQLPQEVLTKIVYSVTAYNEGDGRGMWSYREFRLVFPLFCVSRNLNKVVREAVVGLVSLNIDNSDNLRHKTCYIRDRYPRMYLMNSIPLRVARTFPYLRRIKYCTGSQAAQLIEEMNNVRGLEIVEAISEPMCFTKLCTSSLGQLRILKLIVCPIDHASEVMQIVALACPHLKELSFFYCRWIRSWPSSEKQVDWGNCIRSLKTIESLKTIGVFEPSDPDQNIKVLRAMLNSEWSLRQLFWSVQSLEELDVVREYISSGLVAKACIGITRKSFVTKEMLEEKLGVPYERHRVASFCSVE